MVGGPTGLRDDDSDPSARAMCGFTMLAGYFGPGTQPEIFVNSAGFLELRMFQDAATDNPGVPPGQSTYAVQALHRLRRQRPRLAR
jgi:hypothetical protein